LRDPELFESWLHRILTNACYTEARRRARRSQVIRLLPVEPVHGPDEYLHVEHRDQLERAFRRLTVEQRAVLVFHHYLELPLPEIAIRIGIPARDGQVPHVSRQAGAPGQPRGRGPDVHQSTRSDRMTARDDLDRQLEPSFADGPTELPDPSFYAVRHRTESTRQRVVIGPWRMPDPMNRFAAIGLGTAAVVVALVVGIQLLRPSAPWRRRWRLIGAPSPTPAPTTASPSTSAASPPTLTQSFTSTMHGFSVSYPGGMDRSSGDRALDGSPCDCRIHPPRARCAAGPGPRRTICS
jgi:hypothetical protein